MIKEISRDPFVGIGKPEPLHGDWAGTWSRRINDEHRLIYQVEKTELRIIQARSHYQQ